MAALSISWKDGTSSCCKGCNCCCSCCGVLGVGGTLNLSRSTLRCLASLNSSTAPQNISSCLAVHLIRREEATYDSQRRTEDVGDGDDGGDKIGGDDRAGDDKLELELELELELGEKMRPSQPAPANTTSREMLRELPRKGRGAFGISSP